MEVKTKGRESSTTAEATRHFLSHRFLREKRFSQKQIHLNPSGAGVDANCSMGGSWRGGDRRRKRQRGILAPSSGR